MIWLIDSTLRDGEQAPGIVFRNSEKLRVAQMLDETGIDEIEAGTPVLGDSESLAIRRIVRSHLRARISVWSRAVKNDIERAALTEAPAVHIAFPVSDIQLKAMNKSWEWVKDALPELTERARQLFGNVSVGAQDAGRCDYERLSEFVQTAGQPGRIRIADTVGRMTPLETVRLMKNLCRRFPQIDFDFHAHNDLGMATANAFTAWQSGASTLSVTVNGLGERAGNASLEQILMLLSQIHGIDKYDTSGLFALCRYVSEISGRPIPPDKPVSGSMAFSHESGIHAKATISETTAFQPFSGQLLGREEYRTFFGKHSGKGALADLLKRNSVRADDKTVDCLILKVKEIASEERRCLYPEEVIRLLSLII
jgi:homocitrate synthase NifV